MRVKIRKGDTVEVINGREEDKGKRGEVIKVLPDEGRIVIARINIRIKHQRETQQKGRNMKPGKIEFEAPLSLANVMLVCPKCSKPTRVGIRREDGESQRICKQCNAVID